MLQQRGGAVAGRGGGPIEKPPKRPSDRPYVPMRLNLQACALRRQLVRAPPLSVRSLVSFESGRRLIERSNSTASELPVYDYKKIRPLQIPLRGPIGHEDCTWQCAAYRDRVPACHSPLWGPAAAAITHTGAVKPRGVTATALRV